MAVATITAGMISLFMSSSRRVFFEDRRLQTCREGLNHYFDNTGKVVASTRAPIVRSYEEHRTIRLDGCRPSPTRAQNLRDMHIVLQGAQGRRPRQTRRRDVLSLRPRPRL